MLRQGVKAHWTTTLYLLLWAFIDSKQWNWALPEHGSSLSWRPSKMLQLPLRIIFSKINFRNTKKSLKKLLQRYFCLKKLSSNFQHKFFHYKTKFPLRQSFKAFWGFENECKLNFSKIRSLVFFKYHVLNKIMFQSMKQEDY